MLDTCQVSNTHTLPEIGEQHRDYRGKQAEFIQEICTAFSVITVNDDSLKNLNSIGLAEVVQIINNEGSDEGCALFDEWLNLEVNKDINHALDETLMQDINSSYNSQLSSDSSLLMIQSSPEFVEQPAESEATQHILLTRDPQTVKLCLLDCCTVAVNIDLNNPVLAELANQMYSELLNENC